MTVPATLSDAKRRLFDKMRSGEGTAGAGAAGRITSRDPHAVVPLSSEQSECWLHQELASPLPIYNESVTIHRKGSFDLTVLERSFNEILRRHEIWRTSIGMVDGEIVQLVLPELEVRLRLDDLTVLPRDEREREALRLATRDAREPFDLAVAPLFRPRVVKLADDDHRLFLAIHHIVFDGISLTRIFIRELAAIYEAFSRGAPSPLPEPTLQYADYAVWQRQRSDGTRLDEKIGHWRDALKAPLPKLGLSTSHERRAPFTYRGATARFSLSAELTAAMKVIGQASGATLYMVLLAAFKTLLFRYTGQQNILIGGVTDQRRRPELQPLMGFFLGMTAMRTQPAADLTFRQYLAQVRLEVLRALDASDVPMDQVIREVGVKREAGGHPLFEAVFSIQPIVDPYPEGWDFTQMDAEKGFTKYDLYLELEERPDGMMGRFIYAADLFEPAMIERMIEHWRMLLEGIVADPDTSLGRLPLITPAESRQILVEWNATEAEIPAASLPDLFETQAKETPDAVAVVFEDRSWTYEELNRRADAVASRLRRAGVREGMLVGICLQRSLEMVAGLLGIMKAGGAYLPLDPNLPRQRISFIIDDAKPFIVLTRASLVSTVDAARIPIVLYDPEAEAERVQTEELGADQLAYVLYTSGSTGNPKGVEVSHSGLTNLLTAMQRMLDFRASDSLLAVATFSFDGAALELFLPLVSGGRVIIAAQPVTSDPVRLAGLIRRSGCTAMHATPTTWRALVETGWTGSKGLTILCGGEVMPHGLADELLKRSLALWNFYGPTETTIVSTVWKVHPGDRPVPIGRPIANTQLYILDRVGNAVPIGVIGELHIGGAGVALGYRNRRDLTQQRFVEKTVAGGARLYRTGDLARYRADGAVEYFGRVDNEEKIRGFRVAVEEIEAALVRHQDVRSAAVRAWPDASGNKALTAYLVARSEHVPTAAEMRRFLGGTLPDYMIPSRFVSIGELPLTPSGKIDRKVLPQMNGDALRPLFVPPIGPLEDKLAEIWREVLGIDSVGRDENFFELGGHSLLVAKLLRRVESEYRRKLTMAAFFLAPTIEAMATILGKDEDVDLPAIPIQPKGSRPPLLWIDGSPAFRPLALAIGPDQPFLGIPVNPLLERNRNSRMRLEDIAAMVVKAVREAQPDGPFYLGGYCDMGVLAYEAAAQLTRSGHVVDLVVLLDTSSPVARWKTRRLALFFSRLRYHMRRLWRLRGQARRDYLATKFHDVKGSVGLRPRETWEELSQTIKSYRPSVFPGDLILFQSADRLDVIDNEPAWRETVRGAMIAQDTPGDHYNMLEEPQVGQLGSALNDVFVRAQKPHFDLTKRAGCTR